MCNFHNVAVHLAWMIRNFKMSFFHPMSQTLDRSISSLTHMFDFLSFYIWRYWFLWYAWLGKIARAIYDVEEATSTAFDIILEHKVDYLFSSIALLCLLFWMIVQIFYVWQMIKPDTRASLIKFLQLLAAHHPSRR